ncbi:hypothetical protein [Streptomyces sp. SM12]|nr:hypothetical protein [Streptomyces sp. SM12]
MTNPSTHSGVPAPPHPDCRDTWSCSGCGVRTGGADYCLGCYKPRPR